MIGLKRAISACILASALMATVAAHAATYYVATTGSNSNPGTEKNPWGTVAYAVNKMVAGDTTYVMAGTYNEGLIQFRRSGTSSQPIRLLAMPGTLPTINFVNGMIDGYVVGSDKILIQHASGFWLPMGWITISGFEIRGGQEGIKIYNCHDCTISHNWLHHNGHGILGNGTRVRIERNIINHNGQFEKCEAGLEMCNGDHGIYANGSAFTVVNNLIYDNMGYGIQLNATVAYSPARHAGVEFAESHNWAIVNNTLAYSRYRGAIVIWRDRANNTRIENNIFYENSVMGASSATNGISFLSGPPIGVVIRNNLAFASESGGTVFITPGSAVEGTHYTQSGNIVNTSNPEFVNAPATLPASPNFALTARSPAIDKGLTLPEITTSFDGTPRPQGRAHDIGAYEYKAGSDAKPPAAPIALQVH